MIAMAHAKAFRPAPAPRACHRFKPAAEQGTNPRGWQWCGTCRRWGNPADPADRGHPPPPTAVTPPAEPRTPRERQMIAAFAELEARILGEHEPE